MTWFGNGHQTYLQKTLTLSPLHTHTHTHRIPGSCNLAKAGNGKAREWQSHCLTMHSQQGHRDIVFAGAQTVPPTVPLHPSGFEVFGYIQ